MHIKYSAYMYDRSYFYAQITFQCYFSTLLSCFIEQYCELSLIVLIQQIAQTFHILQSPSVLPVGIFFCSASATYYNKTINL